MPRSGRGPGPGVLLGVLASLLVACGGGSSGPDAPGGTPDAMVPADADTRDLLIRLNALPGVVAVEEASSDPDERHFDLSITQPVDHGDPSGQSFVQNVTLVHRGFDRPMVAETTGYWNYTQYRDTELGLLLHANQIAIEHRFFESSRPSPADWSKLTIEQSADDEHEIIARLKVIYPGVWVTTGASKGGMTASYHRRFHPDDVDASVPYVAPLSFAAGDLRYATFLDTIGPPACRQALRDLEVELLSQPRFDAMLARAQDQATTDGIPYTRILIGPAVESAIIGIEWSFWQYTGASQCSTVPPVGASDDTMWNFLEFVSSVSGSADYYVEAFEAYYYQAEFELGYPDGGGAFLEGLTRYTDADYTGGLPLGVPAPTYDATAMADVDQWVQTEGDRLLFLYGGWDPWTGGKYELGAATDSLRVIAPQMTHGAGFLDLTASDRAAGYAKLTAWTGVTPDDSFKRDPHANQGDDKRPVAPPRIPPAMLRGLQLRHR